MTIRKVKAANTIKVSIGFKGNLKMIELPKQSKWTVKAVLEKAKIDHEGYHPRIKGSPVSLSRIVKDGDKILLLA